MLFYLKNEYVPVKIAGDLQQFIANSFCLYQVNL